MMVARLTIAANRSTRIDGFLRQRRHTSTSLATRPSLLLPPQASGSMADEKAPDGRGTKPRVVVVTGPTAVGKTRLSLSLAEAIGAEIVSADSVQVYKGLDVGSDKLPESQRRGIPHHLLDILPFTESFSAGDFHDYAMEAVQDILKRGKTPLVVGGTGFYLQFFLHGKAEGPRSTPEGDAAVKRMLAKACEDEGERLGRECTKDEKWEIGVGLVEAAGDPRSAQKLRDSRNNYYRLHRVLEVVTQTGGPMPSLNLDPQDLDYDFRCTICLSLSGSDCSI